ncbi:MAG: hypothetical protein WC314_11895 [Vulcanimicrobiota bacterium]
MKTSLIALLLGAMLSGTALADEGGRRWERATTEVEFYQGLQESFVHENQEHPYTSHQVKIEGEWAFANMVAYAGAGSWLQIFRLEESRWKPFATAGGRGGSATRAELLEKGVPETVVGKFGYGEVPAAAVESLRDIGQIRGSSEFSIATYGERLFGGLHGDRTSKSAPAVEIYECIDGEWWFVFTHQQGDRPLAEAYQDFPPHQLSEYMGACIVSGTAASGKL